MTYVPPPTRSDASSQTSEFPATLQPKHVRNPRIDTINEIRKGDHNENDDEVVMGSSERKNIHLY